MNYPILGKKESCVICIVYFSGEQFLLCNRLSRKGDCEIGTNLKHSVESLTLTEWCRPKLKETDPEVVGLFPRETCWSKRVAKNTAFMFFSMKTKGFFFYFRFWPWMFVFKLKDTIYIEYTMFRHLACCGGQASRARVFALSPLEVLSVPAGDCDISYREGKAPSLHWKFLPPTPPSTFSVNSWNFPRVYISAVNFQCSQPCFSVAWG